MKTENHRPGGRERLILYADGAINPERTGVGLVVLNEREQVVLVTNQTLPAMTSTEAEYAALTFALEIAAGRHVEDVEVRLDSAVVVYQMIGRYAVNSPRLKPRHQQACQLARMLPRVRYTHIAREQNAVADVLAAEAAAGRLWRSVG